MRAALIAHLIALVVGLALAFSASQKDSSSASEDEDLVLAAGELADLTAVSFSSEDGDVKLVPYDDDGALAWAVEMERMVADKAAAKKAAAAAADAPDAGVASDGGAAPAEPEKSLRRFVFPAGRTVTRALEKMAPFVVKRSIDDVPAERLEAMGFAGAEAKPAKLTFTLKGKTLTFDVGGKTYGGAQRYLKDAEGAVHLAPSSIFRGLEGTETRLSERRLVPVELDEMTQVRVQVGDKSRTFLHQEREQPKKRYFADETAPEEKSDEASAVVTDLRRLRSRAWLLPEEIDLEGRELLASFEVRRHEAGALSGKVFSAKDGNALIQVGRWSAHVTEGMAKALIDDVNAALP